MFFMNIQFYSFFVFLPDRLGRREHKKVIKKSQGCARFARKTSVRRLKSFKLACGSNRKDFFTPSSLVFRLTGRGRSVAKGQLLILAKQPDVHLNLSIFTELALTIKTKHSSKTNL
jgi:hypothetical protein